MLEGLMENLLQDLRYGFRMLLKSPGLTLVIALSIGLGIGANTTVFTWMESLILNPYPAVKDSGSLVAVNLADQDGSGTGSLPFSYPAYLDWRTASHSFEGLVAHALIRLNLRQGQ